MFKNPLFLEMIFLALLVFVLDRLASIYHLYWSITEFDSVVHFFAGAALSLFFIWFYYFSGFFNPAEKSLKNFLVVAILGAMFVAFSWEIYELIAGEVAVQKANYSFDTMMDLLMSFLGALAGCFYASLRTSPIQI